MALRTISALKDLHGKRVLLRIDFNIPVPKRGRIGDADTMKLGASVPTIEYLRKAGAAVVIVSHLGRPGGVRRRALSLAPVAARLAEILGSKVAFIKDDLRKPGSIEKRLSSMADGDVALLENIRFYPEEEKNSAPFVRRLAALADIFVNDAFAACHRTHASTVGVAKLLPSYAGYLMEREVQSLGRLLEKPKHPFVILLGGAKVSTKLPMLAHLLKIADLVLVGGGMGITFLRAKGLRVGKMDVGAAEVRAAKRLLGNKKIRLPIDVLVADRMDEKARVRVVASDKVGVRDNIVDIGTETVRRYAAELKKARTIVWNGPVGKFEIKRFSHGSIALGRVIAARSSGKAFGVVGGGETTACLAQTGMAEFVDHVSTGGGAMLEFLEGKTLPGIAPLER